jgi:N,N'-diacetyllegionaminate synthase
MSQRSISIAGRDIGPGHPPYVIGEIGINHDGNVETALKMIDAARDAGVDALKMQTFRTDKFLAKSSPYFDLLRGAELSADDLVRVLKHANQVGITMFSAVFDEGSADMWEAMGAAAYKVASCDITHLPLLKHIARLKKPMIVSTGGATLEEARVALRAIREASKDTPVAFLHCVSHYPTVPAECNLACMATMRQELGTPVGFSDHSVGDVVSIAASALGAELIEKHFTHDCEAPGPDHALSVDPAGLKELVANVHAAFASVGHKEKAPVESRETITAIRRSVTLSKGVSEGQILTRDMLEVKRPGHGIAPKDIDQVVGRMVKSRFETDHTLTWDDLTNK